MPLLDSPAHAQMLKCHDPFPLPLLLMQNNDQIRR